MKHLIFILLSILSINSYSQFEYNSSIENLNDWITITDDNSKTNLINLLKTKYSDNCAFQFFNLEAFYIIDFDNNGLNDILYSGTCGIDGGVTQIFRFDGNDYEIVLSVIGSMFGVNKKQDKTPFSIMVNNYACCGGFTNVLESYIYTLTNNKIKFSLQSRVDFVSELEFPDRYFEKPIAFKTTQKEYKLRFAPIIDDTTEIARPFDAFGNTIHTYSKNSVGYAIAEKKDDTGRIWWLVKMDNRSDPSMEYSKKFGDNNEQLTYSLGWMSSRYLMIYE